MSYKANKSSIVRGHICSLFILIIQCGLLFHDCHKLTFHIFEILMRFLCEESEKQEDRGTWLITQIYHFLTQYAPVILCKKVPYFDKGIKILSYYHNCSWTHCWDSSPSAVCWGHSVPGDTHTGGRWPWPGPCRCYCRRQQQCRFCSRGGWWWRPCSDCSGHPQCLGSGYWSLQCQLQSLLLQ